MNRTFLVEILLRARDEISGAVNKATEAVQNLTKAQSDHGKVAEGTAEKLRGEITELERLTAAHTREKKALDDSAAARRRDADNIRAHTDSVRHNIEAARSLQQSHAQEAAKLAELSQKRQEAIGKVDSLSRSYLSQARTQQRLASEQGRIVQGYQREMQASEQRARSFEVEAR